MGGDRVARLRRGCPCVATRMQGASILTPLILLMTVAMFALLFNSGLLAPQSSLVRMLDSLDLPVAAASAIDHRVHDVSGYGACGDVCVAGGACRHIVLHDGLHGGDKVSLDVLLAAESCH